MAMRHSALCIDSFAPSGCELVSQYTCDYDLLSALSLLYSFVALWCGIPRVGTDTAGVNAYMERLD